MFSRRGFLQAAMSFAAAAVAGPGLTLRDNGYAEPISDGYEFFVAMVPVRRGQTVMLVPPPKELTSKPASWDEHPWQRPWAPRWTDKDQDGGRWVSPASSRGIRRVVGVALHDAPEGGWVQIKKSGTAAMIAMIMTRIKED